MLLSIVVGAERTVEGEDLDETLEPCPGKIEEEISTGAEISRTLIFRFTFLDFRVLKKNLQTVCIGCNRSDERFDPGSGEIIDKDEVLSFEFDL
jgi:hypothetical protein